MKDITSNILTAIGIAAMCIWVLLESVQLSQNAIQKGVAEFYTSPGFLPMIIAIVCLSLCVFVVIYYSGNFLKSNKRFKNNLKAIWSPILIFSQLFVYIFILIPNMPFVIATILFISFFLAVFKACSLIRISLVSLIYSILIVFFFIEVVGVKFPVSLFN